jgi:hypothetical protein
MVSFLNLLLVICILSMSFLTRNFWESNFLVQIQLIFANFLDKKRNTSFLVNSTELFFLIYKIKKNKLPLTPPW